MNNEQRWIYYESGALQRAVAVDLLDWAGYWTTPGVPEITDPVQKAQTRWAVEEILTDLSHMIKAVSAIAITYPAIKDAVEPTEADIAAAVTDIMSFRLAWVTNIHDAGEA